MSQYTIQNESQLIAAIATIEKHKDRTWSIYDFADEKNTKILLEISKSFSRLQFIFMSNLCSLKHFDDEHKWVNTLKQAFLDPRWISNQAWILFITKDSFFDHGQNNVFMVNAVAWTRTCELFGQEAVLSCMYDTREQYEPFVKVIFKCRDEISTAIGYGSKPILEIVWNYVGWTEMMQDAITSFDYGKTDEGLGSYFKRANLL